MTREQRFWAKVDRRGPDECWPWTAVVGTSGYGRLRNEFAHRVSYELAHGSIPPGLTIDHLCAVKTCVNPAHLEAVSIGENIRRYHATRPPRGECRNGHSWLEHAYRTRSGGLRCRLCVRAKSARNYAKNGPWT